MLSYGKYTTGAFTIGVQLSETDKTAADSDITREAAALSFAVNENLSVSYGISTVEYEASTKTDAESTGVSASYTMGGMTLAGAMNDSDNMGGTAGAGDEDKHITMSIAF